MSRSAWIGVRAIAAAFLAVVASTPSVVMLGQSAARASSLGSSAEARSGGRVPVAVATPGAEAAAKVTSGSRLDEAVRQTPPASSDWAGSSFCTAEYDSPYTGNSYAGVAACGTAYGDGGNSNEQGPISYNGVQFDSVGFQCVELVMRYMYYDFGVAPYSANGNTVVSNYTGSVFTKETDPATDGLPGVGDILSFAGTPSNPYGHTSIVTRVSSSSLTTLNENDTSNGLDTVPVSNGVVGGGVTGWLHAPSRQPIQWDFNGDGKADEAFIAQKSDGGFDLRVWLGGSTETFSSPSIWWTTAKGPSYSFSGVEPFAGDFCGDGRTDFGMLAKKSDGGFDLRVACNQGNGTFGNPNIWWTTAKGPSYSFSGVKPL